MEHPTQVSPQPGRKAFLAGLFGSAAALFVLPKLSARNALSAALPKAAPSASSLPALRPDPRTRAWQPEQR